MYVMIYEGILNSNDISGVLSKVSKIVLIATIHLDLVFSDTAITATSQGV